MAAQLTDAMLCVQHYRTQFGSVSLGTEEELKGFGITIPVGETRQIIGYVHRNGTVLVQITRDVPIKDTAGAYTIEMRTTPTELSDSDSWHQRMQAMSVAIWRVQACRNSILTADSYEGYQVIIIIPGCQVLPVTVVDSTVSDLQATVGIPVSEFGGTDVGERVKGLLHKHLALPWYHDQFRDDPLVAALSDTQRTAFTFVMSAILKLTMIWKSYPNQGLSLLEVKNSWGVRPRTRPMVIFDSFPGNSKKIATDAVAAMINPPDWAITMYGDTLANWSAAQQYIGQRMAMGGHELPDATINGYQAMLFEYRPAPVAPKPYVPDDKSLDNYMDLSSQGHVPSEEYIPPKVEEEPLASGTLPSYAFWDPSEHYF